MNPFEGVHVGMAAEKVVIVTPEMTVGHVVPGMPAVYGTPIMIQHMEMAAGSASQSSLPAGYVSVGMMVNVRHLAATPIGHTVSAIAGVTKVEAKSVLFDVATWDGDRKIGDGSRRRGIVNVIELEAVRRDYAAGILGLTPKGSPLHGHGSMTPKNSEPKYE